MKVKLKRGTSYLEKYWPMLQTNYIYEAYPIIDNTLDCLYRVRIEGIVVDNKDIEVLDED